MTLTVKSYNYDDLISDIANRMKQYEVRYGANDRYNEGFRSYYLILPLIARITCGAQVERRAKLKTLSKHLISNGCQNLRDLLRTIYALAFRRR